ncbi:hypothetical protein BN406_06716 (plasmid) [Sinorhizobium meliloti Rm41]|nr:hypothetical protein BN406_06716 [Sinorhizobium meliloti Rm41]
MPATAAASASLAENSTNATPFTGLRTGIGGTGSADAAHPVAQRDQRGVAVGCDQLGRPAAELVVQDFQREVSVISGFGDGSDKGLDRQVALARHVRKWRLQ